MSDAHFHLARLQAEADETREALQIEMDAMRYADEIGDAEGFRIAELRVAAINEELAALTEEIVNLEAQTRRSA